MSVALDQRLRRFGTRFKLFAQPQFLGDYAEPETVWVSSPAGSLEPGPGDDRMYVVRPAEVKDPYQYPDMPPYRGPVLRPVEPDAAGHFDYLDPDSPEFRAAHMFGSLRRVLDIWEGYFGHAIPWHFGEHYERLELVPFLDWDNAHSGYGFIETGFDESSDGRVHRYALNFDVLAHELGHSILFSQLGFPDEPDEADQFLAFHESASDLTALIAVMHFDSVVDRVLRSSRGNLYMLNELNRIGELSATDQIRIASNPRKMSEFVAGWTNIHHLAQPLTGAIFDVLMDVYQDRLLQSGLVTGELLERAESLPETPEQEREIQALFDAAYAGAHEAFKAALLDARDYLGKALASLWGNVSPNALRFDGVGRMLERIDRALSGGAHADDIRENFEWREIGRYAPGPQLEDPGGHRHDDAISCEIPGPASGLSYRQRMRLARGLAA